MARRVDILIIGGGIYGVATAYEAVRRGVPGHKFPLPITPGCDAAGCVDLLGPGVRGWTPGDEVVVTRLEASISTNWRASRSRTAVSASIPSEKS